MTLEIKDRIAELNELISVAQRQTAKARERGANEIAESYAVAEGRWRAQRDRLLSRREQTSGHPDENDSRAFRMT